MRIEDRGQTFEDRRSNIAVRSSKSGHATLGHRYSTARVSKRLTGGTAACLRARYCTNLFRSGLTKIWRRLGLKINNEAVLLRAVDLSKIYSGRAEEVVVFRGLNLDVARGEMVAITGESGAGKSTLLHLLGG